MPETSLPLADPLADALRQISGVPVTAYDSGGGVDLARSARLARRVAEAGIRNIMAAGNTGEFFSLSLDEVRRVHAAVIQGVGGAALVTAAVGRSLVEARDLARAAAEDGAGAVMVHWPADPFAGPSQKADYVIAVAEAAPVPVVAYIRSDELALADLVRLAEHPNLVAVKYAATNMMQLAEAVRATRHARAIWVCGLAEGWAPPFYALGARGFTSGLVNVFPEISLAIHAALEAGDYAAARAEIDRVVGFEQLRTLSANGANVTVVKEALEMLGEPVGPVRLPGVPRLQPEDHARLSRILDAVADRRRAS